jgi:D-sedoheptulose 7-phosphate isomerase
MNQLTALSSLICKSVDELAINIDAISSQLEAASEHIVNTLLNDGKLLICSNSYAAPFGEILTTSLMHQQAFERPSLPALNLSIDSTTISAIGNNGNHHNVYAKQVRAIGRKGDCLITLSIEGNCSNLVQAIQIAHEKEINVVAISGFLNGKITETLQQKDKEVTLHAQSLTNAMELMLVSVNGLCRKIESQLFGIPLE